ncbi:MAG TPA: SDR family NAD(P)-dependent oxidoreductase [Acidobacteriaceae bacterium]|jgi:NAD(P)-dependent dehydrogenase (short-subunit alcohol dehydrogenase family)|nr:SDR family NAD(P)-dependent oxidoreductase [Acidobacteriaceae bacterium]
MKIDLAGKVAVVAGGTGGLGRAVSLAFLEEGAKVVVPYHSEKEFAELRRAAAGRESQLIGRMVDVLEESAVAKFVEEIGRIDVLVNTVGGYVGGVELWKLAPADFDRMLNLNLRSGYLLARAVAPGMLARGSGAVVNVSAKAALDHGAGASAYAASKAASLAMMDSLAAETRGKGVRVNSVLPSIIDTPANRGAMPDADFATWPKPEAIAKVILFLCSDAASVVHGAAVPVYGES